MTRKDYILLAKEINSAWHAVSLDKSSALLYLANHLAGALALDNPRFDREKFLAACEKGPK